MDSAVLSESYIIIFFLRHVISTALGHWITMYTNSYIISSKIKYWRWPGTEVNQIYIRIIKGFLSKTLLFDPAGIFFANYSTTETSVRFIFLILENTRGSLQPAQYVNSIECVINDNGCHLLYFQLYSTLSMQTATIVAGNILRGR